MVSRGAGAERARIGQERVKMRMTRLRRGKQLKRMVEPLRALNRDPVFNYHFPLLPLPYPVERQSVVVPRGKVWRLLPSTFPQAKASGYREVIGSL